MNRSRYATDATVGARLLSLFSLPIQRNCDLVSSATPTHTGNARNRTAATSSIALYKWHRIAST